LLAVLNDPCFNDAGKGDKESVIFDLFGLEMKFGFNLGDIDWGFFGEDLLFGLNVLWFVVFKVFHLNFDLS
jgi:hypothetical protein